MEKFGKLKKIFAITLLLAVSLKPSYYLAEIVYYELNIDYIIETYCVNKDKPELQCNGKCHLAKQLQVSPSTNEESKNSNTSAILGVFYPLFFQTSLQYTLDSKPFFVEKKMNWAINTTYKFLLDKSDFKPPTVTI